jgi:arylsulfatase A-like enzyme
MLRTLIAGLLGMLTLGAAPRTDKPNVVLIITDDQGFGDVASHGNPHINTPVHDRLAASGARFDRFYVSPVCAPTRGSLLTGRYNLRAGVFGVTRGYETIHANELTIAEALKANGYRTGAFGKWHNGRYLPNHPNGQGFDTFFGFCGGHWNRYHDANLERNGVPVETKGYIIDTLTDSAMGFIRANRNRPFFCYIPYNTPHSPWRVPEKWWRKYNGKGLDEQAQCAYAMVENIDWNVGRVLKLLDTLKLAKNTIVIFMTDNGANSDRFNAGMKGRKGSVDEGGVRVPFFIRYPGVIKSGTKISNIAAHIDVLPTLMDLCGVKKPEGKPLDGINLAPWLRGQGGNYPERMIFSDRFRGDLPIAKLKGSVRTSQWRAVLTAKKWRLYDMLADPGQKIDVASKHSGVVKNLSAAFDEWFSGTGATELTYHPIPVGHPKRPSIEIPANESVLSPAVGKGITYKGSPAGFANTWIREWTSTEAYPTWKLDILNSGTYRVAIRHSLADKDVGAKIGVEIGDQQLTARLDHAFDMPLVHKSNRYLPADGYEEKAAWKWLELGTLKLSKGATEMRVRALEIPGESSIDLRAVRLTHLGK